MFPVPRVDARKIARFGQFAAAIVLADQWHHAIAVVY
jgi:hypothetical protein